MLEGDRFAAELCSPGLFATGENFALLVLEEDSRVDAVVFAPFSLSRLAPAMVRLRALPVKELDAFCSFDAPIARLFRRPLLGRLDIALLSIPMCRGL